MKNCIFIICQFELRRFFQRIFSKKLVRLIIIINSNIFFKKAADNCPQPSIDRQETSLSNERFIKH
jgi:hypothetical protein